MMIFLLGCLLGFGSSIFTAYVIARITIDKKKGEINEKRNDG